ncbi:protein of unknown function (DUF4837) [Fodinibius salinus]|uniref:DUF4837 domain-containing protein n=1 Tax=Fodinibius salinus TaxID=860790 RepID=A0A5D3YQ55_9BACT|nr:DUF4837 family protein [Fodinibius salinus]TYP95113.1 protein of unknown function (DUF4837) [Fodinibius salinus]
MKLSIKVFIVLLSALWIGCEGDYRQKATGSFGQVIVVMDSSQFQSQTAEALRQTYGEWTQTIPGKPPRFDLTFRDFNTNDQLEQLKRYRNLIIAAPITDSTNTADFMRALLSEDVEQQVRSGESFAFPIKDQWYRDQWVMLLSATSDSALAKQIHNSQQTLTENLVQKELQRWKAEIYDQGEKIALEDSVWDNHGWKIRIQHDWVKHLDTTYTHKGEENNFLTIRRKLPNNDRWFWAWWKKVDNINQVDNDWINAKRDSLMKKWIRGSRDSSYVTTEYRREVNTKSFTLNDDIAYETLGTWRMTNDAMGGPFANLTIFDDESGRLFMLEFGQFAPKYNKRRFVRQFRAMLRTFESDSTWKSPNQDSMQEQ